MSAKHIRFLTFAVFIALGPALQSTKADAIFTFETDPAGLAAPFSNTVNGLTATFSGSATVCSSAGLFTSLSGNVLIQSLCGPSTETGTLSISFSSSVNGVSLNYATAGGAGTLNLTAYQNATQVGTINFVSAVPSGFFNGEGIAAFSGIFNRVTLTGASLIALDNINASTVPEPSSLAVLSGVLSLFGAFIAKKAIRKA